MSNTIKKTAVQASRRRLLQGAAGLAAMGLPAISLAQNKPIKIQKLQNKLWKIYSYKLNF
jgi:hypothetical protein